MRFAFIHANTFESSCCVRRRNRVENTENAAILLLVRRSKMATYEDPSTKLNEFDAAELVYPYNFFDMWRNFRVVRSNKKV